MKTAAIWTAVVAVAALASGAAAKTAQKEEGYCKDDTTCVKLAPGYTCVSVQTTRENTEEVKQCLPSKVAGGVCAGINPGLCPSFSTWSKEFKSISSVCAYIIPTAKCAADNTADSTKGTVSCLNVTATSTSETKYSVIYGCVDYDGSKLLHEANSKSAKMATAFNYSAIISAGCVNPKNAAGSDVVCSGRGTCSPNVASQMDYKCLCNVGYSGTYCQKIDSNKCTMTAQCAAGKCDLIAQECKCEAGTTGNQCAECDPTSTSACNKHGTCGMSPGTVSAAGRRWLLAAAGSGSGATGNNTVGSTTNSNANTNTSSSSSGGGNTCTCESGYAGAHCDRKVASTQKSTTNPTTNSTTETPAPSKDSSASSVAFSTIAVVSTLLVAALI